MEVRCHKCGHAYRVPRTIFDTQEERVTLACTSCGNSFQVLNPKLRTLRVEVTDRKAPSITAKVNFEGRELRLPENQELSLKVLEGEEKGTVYPVNKPRITIGRANADIAMNDRATSRVHCALEVSPQGIVLRDLASTNGTLVNGKLIQVAELTHGSTFRVGSHLFGLVISPRRK